MISVHFQGKPFNITVTQVYASTTNAKQAEGEQFYEHPQDLLELTPKKDVHFIIGAWNAKVRSQEKPGVIGKFGIRIQNKAEQRLTEFFQLNTLVIANTIFQQHKRWTPPDGKYQSQNNYVLCSQRRKNSIHPGKKDQELTVAQMNS